MKNKQYFWFSFILSSIIILSMYGLMLTIIETRIDLFWKIAVAAAIEWKVLEFCANKFIR